VKRLGFAAALALMSFVAPARADLADDVETVLERYRRSGAQARRADSLFLANGATRAVSLPLASSEEFPCVTVLALGVRAASFSLDVQGGSRLATPPVEEDGPEPADDEPDHVAPTAKQSKAGFVERTMCRAVSARGAATARPEDGARASVVITQASPRGTIEVLVARHAGALPPTEEILLERALGVLEQVDDRGAPLWLAPIAERLERATQSARRDGADQIGMVPARSSAEGTGALVLQLAEGCHRIGVLADADADGLGSVDIDAELRVPNAAHPVRFDRSHAPDARLDLCVPESRRLELRWLGAGGPRPVTLFDARWNLPRIPGDWSLDERAALAGALHKRRAPHPTTFPTAEWTGLAGATHVPMPTEPGACYLAAFVLADADASVSRLTVSSEGDTYHDEAVDEPRGAAVTFCAGSDSRARALVEVRGRVGAWRMAMWRLGGSGP
jgi:hypothetical protein